MKNVVGDSWTHPTLVAPFDIPISKTDTEIEQDRALMQELYTPIFILDTTSSYIFASDSVIYDLVVGGIIPPSEKSRYSERMVRVVCGNVMQSILCSEIPTPDQVSALASQRGMPQAISYQIRSNMLYDAKINDQALKEFLSELSLTKGLIRSSEVIVEQGAIIDNATKQKLDSYQSEYQHRMGHSNTRWMMYCARFVLVFAILLLSNLFLNIFSPELFVNQLRYNIFIWILLLIMVGLVSLSEQLESISPFIIPLPVVAIYLLTFFNMKVAVLGNIVVVLICMLFVHNAMDFFLINFTGGMVAILMLRHLYLRINLFKAVGVIFIVQALLLFCLSFLIQEVPSREYFVKLFFVLIGSFLTLGFYQAIYLVERGFGFISALTLLELSDTNQKLLLALAQQAPGTFQHSVQVANLAESAAKAIGANPLLARCGALYHDIGKMRNPFYFVENLSGVFNPHDDISPQRSAQIIRTHVTDGVAIAREAKIPAPIIDFIERHHGNSLIYYFYEKSRRANGEVSVSDFCYPGETPVEKEVSICMMADAVEAASRSLASYEKEPLEQLVDRIIDKQISDGQFVGSKLSFSEVETIKSVFKSKLNTIYHGRIAYPVRK